MLRCERKYRVPAADMAILEARCRELLAPDPFMGKDGKYRISSVYFDDIRDSCYRDSLNGIPVRTKYRIRIYNRSLDCIKLEIKKRRGHLVEKDTALLTVDEAKTLLKGEDAELVMDSGSLGNERESSEEDPENSEDLENTECTENPKCTEKRRDPVKEHFLICMDSMLLTPKVIVSYERSAYLFESGNVRITFDRNITAGKDFRRFGKKKMILTNTESEGILEVKYDQFLPTFIEQMLETGNLQEEAHSKYCLCRQALDRLSI